MKKISEKLFINIFANVIICLVIVAVFSFSLGGDIFTTASADGEKPIYNGNRGGKSGISGLEQHSCYQTCADHVQDPRPHHRAYG